MARPAVENDEEFSVTRCICGLNDDASGFMLCCEQCEVWQHGECVGLEPENTPDQYFCERCRPDDPIHVKNREVSRKMSRQPQSSSKAKRSSGPRSSKSGKRKREDEDAGGASKRLRTEPGQEQDDNGTSHTQQRDGEAEDPSAAVGHGSAVSSSSSRTAAAAVGALAPAPSTEGSAGAGPLGFSARSSAMARVRRPVAVGAPAMLTPLYLGRTHYLITAFGTQAEPALPSNASPLYHGKQQLWLSFADSADGGED